MALDLETWSACVRRLDAAIAALAADTRPMGLPPPDEHQWHQLLCKKLLPQLATPPFLVVALVGGTNIGKSLLFNHLAGEVASAVSPLAAGTKHPVCLVPPGFDDSHSLARVFTGFRLVPWRAAEDPLHDSPEDLLYWRTGPNVPPRLLLLDAPDVDSDARVNWGRARAIRQVADVLIAVLTQQKYNDAAVKQFFREAVEADKPIIVVFNQVDLEADRPYWPQWLDTFCRQTGAMPELVYVVPLDRDAAARMVLPFYEVGRDGRRALAGPASLREELARLHFDAIKIRTFRGALARVLDPQRGAPAWLAEIRARSADFAAAQRILGASEMARVNWPTLPPSVLIAEIAAWWDASRQPWSRGIHRFYRALGRGVTWPARKAWEWATGPAGDPLADFQHRERQAILGAVQNLLGDLERLAQVGNETLRPRLSKLLGGMARQQLLQRVEAAHQSLPAVDEHYRAFLRAELDAWQRDNPGVVRFLRSLDNATAVARPAISVLLVLSGWHLAGDLVGQAAAHAAGAGMSQLAQEAAITGGFTVGGEILVSTTGGGIRQAAARLFLRLQSRYAQQRADWLAKWLEEELLGGLLDELRYGAELPERQSFRNVEAALAALAPALSTSREAGDG